MLGQQAFWDSMSLALAILDSVNPFLTIFYDPYCATLLICHIIIYLLLFSLL